ncbi:MAG: hypothetical protein ABI345_16190, partial [Jatrophihabitans sp.]
MNAIPDSVRDLIAPWIQTQRWFPGKGRRFTVEVNRLAELSTSPQVTIWTARATYDTGEVETYQVPLVARSEPSEALVHVLLGTVETEAGLRWVYDALHDKDATHAWLTGLVGEPGTNGLRFTRYADVD